MRSTSDDGANSNGAASGGMGALFASSRSPPDAALNTNGSPADMLLTLASKAPNEHASLSDDEPPAPPSPRTSRCVANTLDKIAPVDRIMRFSFTHDREHMPAVPGRQFTEVSWPAEQTLPHIIPPAESFPSGATLARLLHAYWNIVHPGLPGAHRSYVSARISRIAQVRDNTLAGEATLWQRFHMLDDNLSFLVLVFAMLSSAAVHVPERISEGMHAHAHESDDYFQLAMRLLSFDPYHRASDTREKLWRCHALLLLSAREFAVGLFQSSYMCVRCLVFVAFSADGWCAAAWRAMR